jgi:UDP-glucuronate decarboxylase
MNLGNPNEFTIKQLAEKVIDITESKSKIIYKSLPEDDPKQRQPNINYAEKTLNWFPKIQLNDGLKITYEWFDNIRLRNII